MAKVIAFLQTDAGVITFTIASLILIVVFVLALWFLLNTTFHRSMSLHDVPKEEQPAVVYMLIIALWIMATGIGIFLALYIQLK